MKLILALLIALQGLGSFAAKEDSLFTGRVSRSNPKASLMRVRVDFANYKFLDKGDRVQFWTADNAQQICSAYVKGTGSKYVLLKVREYHRCVSRARVAVGSFLYFRGTDLLKNQQLARKLTQIILKKRLALESRLLKGKKVLSSYTQRIDLVNKRYQVLKEKLEIEWQNELAQVEENKNASFQVYKGTLARIEDLDFKLEKYKVYEHDVYEDRWSLDEKIYQKTP